MHTVHYFDEDAQKIYKLNLTNGRLFHFLKIKFRKNLRHTGKFMGMLLRMMLLLLAAIALVP